MVVFGRTLNELAILYYKPVPTFLEKCFSLIIEKGLDQEGIFRISGRQPDIQQLQDQIDATDDISFSDEVSPFVVANIISRFFQSIKGHVLIDSRADDWAKATTAEEIKHLYERLPLMNRALLSRLFGLFYIITQHTDQNRMDSLALSICISPNLVTKTTASGEESLFLLPKEVGQIMIDEYLNIFESMPSVDKNGNFLSESDFANSIGDICMEFFCKSSPVEMKLKPMADEKHCRLNRNIPIYQPTYNEIMEELLDTHQISGNTLNEYDYDLSKPIVI